MPYQFMTIRLQDLYYWKLKTSGFHRYTHDWHTQQADSLILVTQYYLIHIWIAIKLSRTLKEQKSIGNSLFWHTHTPLSFSSSIYLSISVFKAQQPTYLIAKYIYLYANCMLILYWTTIQYTMHPINCVCNLKTHTVHLAEWVFAFNQHTHKK